MKKFKMIKSGEKFGVHNNLTNEQILQGIYDFIEIYFDTYFYVSMEGRKYVLNNNGELIFDFKNEPIKNQFTNDYGTFQLLCIEEKDNEFLSFYGENINNSTPEKQQVYQAVIHKNTVAKRLMSKKEYLKEMNDSTGFKVDRENLKELVRVDLK